MKLQKFSIIEEVNERTPVFDTQPVFSDKKSSQKENSRYEN
jgi:hypothetical protein